MIRRMPGRARRLQASKLHAVAISNQYIPATGPLDSRLETAALAARRHSGSREGRRKILLRRARTEPEPDAAAPRLS
jgi:hypothetical protein